MIRYTKTLSLCERQKTDNVIIDSNPVQVQGTLPAFCDPSLAATNSDSHTLHDNVQGVCVFFSVLSLPFLPSIPNLLSVHSIFL